MHSLYPTEPIKSIHNDKDLTSTYTSSCTKKWSLNNSQKPHYYIYSNASSDTNSILYSTKLSVHTMPNSQLIEIQNWAACRRHWAAILFTWIEELGWKRLWWNCSLFGEIACEALVCPHHSHYSKVFVSLIPRNSKNPNETSQEDAERHIHPSNHCDHIERPPYESCQSFCFWCCLEIP